MDGNLSRKLSVSRQKGTTWAESHCTKKNRSLELGAGTVVQQTQPLPATASQVMTVPGAGWCQFPSAWLFFFFSCLPVVGFGVCFVL